MFTTAPQTFAPPAAAPSAAYDALAAATQAAIDRADHEARLLTRAIAAGGTVVAALVVLAWALS
jgi:hypothetical protein